MGPGLAQVSMSCGETNCPTSLRSLAVETSLVQDFQNLAGREDVEVLGDVRARRKFGPLMLIQRCHLTDRQVTFGRQRGDDPSLIWLLLVAGRHDASLDVCARDHDRNTRVNVTDVRWPT